jgi:hypothetical protein
MVQLKENSVLNYIKNNPKRVKQCPTPDCKGFGQIRENHCKCVVCEWHICWLCKEAMTYVFVNEKGEKVITGVAGFGHQCKVL